MNAMRTDCGYQTTRRRATALLTVVTILALLFLIVAGFLSLARVRNASQTEFAAADQINAAVDRVAEMTLDAMGQALRDEKGESFGVAGTEIGTFETIPGVGATHWLGALEPVWDPRAAANNVNPLGDLSRIGFTSLPGDWWVLAKLIWPAVSSLEPTGPNQPVMARVYELMFEDTDDADAKFDVVDALRFAIAPILDADGDGIPDADLLATRRATILANAMQGISLDLPSRDTGFEIAHIPQSNINTPQARFARSTARQILDAARYIAAVRVVSHGAMVALDAPTLVAGGPGFGQGVVPIQRAFQADLFNRLLADQDWDNRIPLHQLGSVQVNELFDRLAAARGAVEMALRRRYLLPNAYFAGTRRVPDILAELQGEAAGRWQFPFTFVNPLAARPTQWARRPVGPLAAGGRINLADDGIIPLPGPAPVRPLGAWARLAAEDAVRADSMTRSFAPLDYDRRHLITTVSYSDELARKLDPDEPDAPDDLGTYRGEQRFYLGEIAKAFDAMQRWQYLGNPTDNRLDPGELVVREIARRFYDMLAPYDWGNGVFSTAGTQNPQQDPDFMTRREQALMLAVNTVAFAARRDAQGRIDRVVYRDRGKSASDPTDDVTYIGYAPQPFFSELIVYNDARLGQPDEPEPPPDVAIAVELYNPNDPFFSTFNPNDPSANQDVFALNLDQFVLTVEGASGGEIPLASFSPTLNGRLNGRSFMTVVIKDSSGGNGYFDSVLPAGILPASRGLPAPTDLTVKLWWRSPSGARYLIDRISIKGHVGPNQWRSAARDTSPVPYFRMDLDGDANLDSDLDGNPAIDYPARWGVAVGRVTRGHAGRPPTRQTLGNARYLARGVINPDQDADANGIFDHRFAPPVPLIAMNAGADPTLPIFPPQNNVQAMTDLRPASFPTPGFMLFVPRYCAVRRASAPPNNGQQEWTVPELLARVARARGIPKPRPNPSDPSVTLTADQYPADLGHMPVFDNHQDLDSGPGANYLRQAGRIPWGLLVFDYFTTLDPAADLNGDGVADVDPLRIAGRININTAPWTVLARLPMLGPDPSTGVLPLLPPGVSNVTPDLPAPSFWDPTVGVLTGFGGIINGRAEPRLIAIDPTYTQPTETFFTATRGRNVPYRPVGRNPRYRLGYWLAQAACAYRDGIPYVGGDLVDGDLDGQPEPLSEPYQVFADAYLRNGPALRYRPQIYGPIRGQPANATELRPKARGFLTVGELLNVKGFDSSRHDELLTAASNANPAFTVLGRGDFVKAVSILALLDTQWLTTRSHTFTVYVSIYDRQQPQRSTRYQATVDRSDLLPRIDYVWLDPQNGVYVTRPTASQRATLVRVPRLMQVRQRQGMGFVTRLVPVRSEPRILRPSILALRRVGYFDTRFDD